MYLKPSQDPARDRGLTHSAYCVFLLQNPTFPIASDMVASSAASTFATVSSPRELRKFDTAQCVTSSFVWEESIKETSITNLLVYHRTFVEVSDRS